MDDPLVRNISDTALWVAYYRAEESDRPDAVFRDRFARALAGERGAQIAGAQAFSNQNSWSYWKTVSILNTSPSQSATKSAR